jgi:RNA polymerase sigma-70 factor (ECF subfamily)
MFTLSFTGARDGHYRTSQDFCYFWDSALIWRALPMTEPTTPHAAFRPTRWSLVARSLGEGEEARRALDDLCQAYWFPLYAWARRFGSSPTDAEDLVQGFFVQVLTRKLFATADAARGKLRTFLLTSFRHHVLDVQRKTLAERRGGGNVISFDGAEAEAWYEVEQIEGESADHMFDRQWALTVLDHALAAVERQAEARGRAREFAVIRPLLTGDAATVYEEAAAALGLSVNAFRVALHRARAQFREALRAEILETQPDATSVDEEMTYLLQVLRGT